MWPTKLNDDDEAQLFIQTNYFRRVKCILSRELRVEWCHVQDLDREAPFSKRLLRACPGCYFTNQNQPPSGPSLILKAQTSQQDSEQRPENEEQNGRCVSVG
jgi:hypothetical protein